MLLVEPWMLDYRPIPGVVNPQDPGWRGTPITAPQDRPEWWCLDLMLEP